MRLGKSQDAQPADGHGFPFPKGFCKGGIRRETTLFQGRPGDINRQLVPAREDLEPADMIVVFVGNEDGLYAVERQPESTHPPFGFPAGEARVDKDGFLFVTDIITVAVAA